MDHFFNGSFSLLDERNMGEFIGLYERRYRENRNVLGAGICLWTGSQCLLQISALVVKCGSRGWQEMAQKDCVLVARVRGLASVPSSRLWLHQDNCQQLGSESVDGSPPAVCIFSLANLGNLPSILWVSPMSHPLK